MSDGPFDSTSFAPRELGVDFVPRREREGALASAFDFVVRREPDDVLAGVFRAPRAPAFAFVARRKPDEVLALAFADFVPLLARGLSASRP